MSEKPKRSKEFLTWLDECRKKVSELDDGCLLGIPLTPNAILNKKLKEIEEYINTSVKEHYLETHED